MDGLETISVGRVLEVRVTGKLTKEAYQKFVPAVDAQVKEYGKLRILFVMQEFHGLPVQAGSRPTASFASLAVAVAPTSEEPRVPKNASTAAR